MCHAIPAKIITLLPEDLALVEIGGITKQISTALLEDLNVGDYVIIHVGFALTKLQEQEALKTLALYHSWESE